MLKIVCALLVLLIMLPAIVFSYSRVQRARKRRVARPRQSKSSAAGPLITAGEVPPSESGKWRVEPIMQILREAKAKKEQMEQSALSEEPIAPPVEPGV